MAYDGSDWGEYLRLACVYLTLAVWLWNGAILPLP